MAIRLGDTDYFSAAAAPCRDFPAWPPADLPPLVRRRPASEGWKDRRPSDPPIECEVTIEAAPPRPDILERRRELKALVAEAGERDGATGWDAGIIDRYARAGRRARGGLIYTPTPAFHVRLRPTAATADAAIRAARERLVLPAGRELCGEAHPA